ncbi:MAG TPA: ABC transporter substrate-binding protein [Clostridia bacterium]
MKRRNLVLFLACIMVLLAFTSCAAEEKIEQIKVVAPAGATAVSIVKPMKDTAELDGTKIEYEVVPTTDLIVARLTANEADLAIVPVNLAAQLYRKQMPYKLTSVVTWGNLYIASTEDIEGWDALKSEDVYMMGKGLVPDIVFRTLCKENGIDPDTDINIIYLSGATELAPNFLAGKAKISMLPEPVLTTVKSKQQNTKVFLDLQQEWKKSFGTELGFPQAGIFVSDELIRSSPGFVKKYIQVLKEGMDWINENPGKAGEYAEEMELGLQAVIVEKSMPGNNIKHEYVKDVRAALDSFFKVLYDFNPETVGGKVPDDGLYYEIQ